MELTRFHTSSLCLGQSHSSGIKTWRRCLKTVGFGQMMVMAKTNGRERG